MSEEVKQQDDFSFPTELSTPTINMQTCIL